MQFSQEKPVLDKNYKERLPKIAFNPLTDEIEVLNSSREKSPEWINNITEIFDGSLLKIIREYTFNLKEKKT